MNLKRLFSQYPFFLFRSIYCRSNSPKLFFFSLASQGFHINYKHRKKNITLNKAVCLQPQKEVGQNVSTTAAQS